MDLKHENKQSDDIVALKDKITELEGLVEFTNYENIGFQRRLYLNFELLLDCGQILKKVKKELGEKRFKEIHDDYMKNEKAQVMAKQKKIAKKGMYGKMFKEMEQTFSNFK